MADVQTNSTPPLVEQILRDQVERCPVFKSLPDVINAMNGMTTRDIMLALLRAEQMGYQRGLARGMSAGRL